MLIKKLTVKNTDFPEVLANIPDPPRQLYHAGTSLNELLKRPTVAIVGSRKVSAYGRQVTTQLAGDLAERGIVIISGLAMGVDALAHRVALETGGRAIAVLPGHLGKIIPTLNRRLAWSIIERGGALVSEYGEHDPTYKLNFIARNRLVSGLSRAVLITEAAQKSGSLHTANFAIEQGRELLAVPGNITSPSSAGANNLIKTCAAPVTSYKDVMNALGLKDENAAARQDAHVNYSPQQQVIINFLKQGITDGEALLSQSKLTASDFARTLTMLEITGAVRALGANHWSLG